MNGLRKFLITLCCCAMLISCSRVTQSNFDKIKPNMKMNEIVAILGQPTRVEDVTIFGVSGTAAIWKDKNSEIDILFLNNNFVLKNFKQSNETVISDQKKK